MSNPIEDNANKILIALFENNPDEKLQFNGNDISEYTNLTPQEINNAIDYLDERELLERLNYLGTSPYNFGHVCLNSSGKYIYHELMADDKTSKNGSTSSEIITQQPLAAGSPFGFTSIDWEYVQKESKWSNSIKVVLGYQFKSDYYDTDRLIDNVKNDFEFALKQLNEENNTNITLNFKPLAAGYGEHLFNQIARDIISSDVAVFETSDLNPNVMVEMGVALTWGKRVLPIKIKDRPKPPSDISGQTYADYKTDAKHYTSSTHIEDLKAMIERAIQEKRKN